MRRILILAVLAVSFCTTAVADIVIDGYSDETNDRFTNSSDFIGAGLDFSGLGQNSGRRWATLISRNVVLSAAHFTPNNSTVYFYEGNDATATPITRTVESGMRIGSTDIWLGVLNSNVPTSITAYDVASELLSAAPNPNADEPLDSAGIYQGMNAYLVGRSPYDTGSDATRDAFNDQAIGRNLITGYAENVAFQSNSDNDSLIMRHDNPGDADFVEFEAEYRGGDSGGPLFVEIGGELRVIGVNSYLLEDEDENLIGNGATYLGNQYDEIQAFIELNAVPEPSSAVAILAIAGLMTTRRRKLLK